MNTPLADAMVKYATAHPDHPKAAELCVKAQAFDDATTGYYGETQTHTAQQFLGAWARARRLLSEVSGEPLI